MNAIELKQVKESQIEAMEANQDKGQDKASSRS